MNNEINNIYNSVQFLIKKNEEYLELAKKNGIDLAIREYHAKLTALHEVIRVICAEMSVTDLTIY